MDIALIILFGAASVFLLIFSIIAIIEFSHNTPILQMIKDKGFMTLICSTLLSITILIYSIVQTLNPPLAKTYILPISTIKESNNNISHQISFVTDGTVINVTRLFGKTFPENSKLNIDVYGGWKGGIYISRTISYTVTTPEENKVEK